MSTDDQSAFNNQFSQGECVRTHQNTYTELCDNPNMRNEDMRLNSFCNWPQGHIKAPPKVIADAGLYYTGNGDCCKCFYCGGGLKAWDWEDDPWEEHAKWHPYCGYLKEQKGQEWISGIRSKFPNIQPFSPLPPRPITDSLPVTPQPRPSAVESAAISAPAHRSSVCPSPGTRNRGLKRAIRNPIRKAQRLLRSITQVQADAGGFQEQRNILNNQPQYQEEENLPHLSPQSMTEFDGSNASMGNVQDRLSTFRGWHYDMSYQNLAEAGFYRHTDIREGDLVFCFQCGGGLHRWNEMNDAFEYHALHFGRCPFVLQKKGQNFVHEVLSRNSSGQEGLATGLDTIV